LCGGEPGRDGEWKVGGEKIPLLKEIEAGGKTPVSPGISADLSVPVSERPVLRRTALYYFPRESEWEGICSLDIKKA